MVLGPCQGKCVMSTDGILLVKNLYFAYSAPNYYFIIIIISKSIFLPEVVYYHNSKLLHSFKELVCI